MNRPFHLARKSFANVNNTTPPPHTAFWVAKNDNASTSLLRPTFYSTTTKISAMAQNPPKQTYNFSFDSPDLRARRVKKESIYDDSSDEDSPKQVPRMGMVNEGTSSFGATNQSRGGFSAFSGLNRQGGSVFASAVKTENSGTSPLLFKETSLQGAAFGVQNAKENHSAAGFGANKASPSAFTSNGFGGGVLGSAATNAQDATGRSALQDMELLGGLTSSGGRLAQPLNGFASAASTPGTSSFTAATTTSANAGSVPGFQHTGTQGRQSLSPFGAPATAMVTKAQSTSPAAFQGTTSQGMSALVSASSTSGTSGTSSFAVAKATVTAQAAAGPISQNSAAQTPQSLEPPATTKSTIASTAAATLPKPNKAQTEETRIFAAHMKLLDHSSASQDLHEVSGAPMFTKKVLDHSENLFSQYGFLAGISTILDSNAAMSLDASKPSRPVDPRLFFNISAPSSAFICGSQGSGKSHTLSCLLENCLMKSDVSKLENPLAGLVFHYDSFTSDVKGTPYEAAHISSNPNVKVRVLVSPTNLQTMKASHPFRFT